MRSDDSEGFPVAPGDGVGTIMVPSSDTTVFRETQIMMLRQLSDSQASMAKAIERMAENVNDLRSEVAGLKGQNLGQHVERLEQKMDAALVAQAGRVDSTRGEMDTKVATLRTDMGGLLDESRKDRQALWLAVTELKGKILPLFALAMTVASAVVAVIVKAIPIG